MNRRSFFKLALGGVAATAAIASLPSLLTPESTAYRTYIFGENATFNNRPMSEPLTLADIRRCVEELKKADVKLPNGQFVGWVHPQHADEVAEWIQYKWNYKWTAVRS